MNVLFVCFLSSFSFINLCFCLPHAGLSCSVKRGIPTSVMCTMKHASMCCAKGHRYCCCQRERCHRAWPGHTETSSAVRSVCRYRHTGGGGRDSIITLIKSKFGAFHHADVCGYFFFSAPVPPDDIELDWCQTGGRPVREGQCQCHRQSQQHLHALLRCRGHEDMRGGERTRVAQHPEPLLETLSVGSANRISSSKARLTLSDQFLHQECLFCVWLLSDPSRASAFACRSVTAFGNVRSELQGS